MILKELIQRALEIATKGLPVDRSAVEIAVEAVVPVVFDDLGRELASSSRTRHLLNRIKQVDVVDGSVMLADDVLSEYACEAVLFDPADTAKSYSHIDWTELARGVLDPRLGHFTINEGRLVVVEPEDAYDPTSGPTISLRLIIPCNLTVPTLNSQVDIPAEALELLTKRLAQALIPVLPK